VRHVSTQTQKIAEDWKANPYYDRAEQEDWMDLFWGQDSHFRRLFEKLDTTVAVDLACGHGRHSARLLSIKTGRHRPKKLYLLDVNQENVEYCKARFAGNPGVQAFRNNGYDFAPLGDSAVSAIVCYDAMVHFEYDAVLSYIRDAFRILAPSGRALFHHSNLDSTPGGDYKQNPHWRNFMSKNLFAHAANRAGFKVLEQVTLNWDSTRKLDCLSFLEKPSASTEPSTLTPDLTSSA
jgi:SAM-dependent methyltransferase